MYGGVSCTLPYPGHDHMHGPTKYNPPQRVWGPHIYGTHNSQSDKKIIRIMN